MTTFLREFAPTFALCLIVYRWGLTPAMVVAAVAPLVPGATGVARHRSEFGAWGRATGFYALAVAAAAVCLAGVARNSFAVIVFGALAAVWLFVWWSVRELQAARAAASAAASTAPPTASSTVVGATGPAAGPAPATTLGA